MGYFCGWVGFNIDLRSTNVVEQLSFYLFPSTLTFDFYFILGSFLTFGTLTGYCHSWPRLTNSTELNPASPGQFGATKWHYNQL